MKKITIVILCLLFSYPVLYGQVIIDDVMINDPNQNTKGIARTAISVAANGNIAVAWQDFNDYNIPVAEQPRVMVQMFTQNLQAVGPLNVFSGESRQLSIWTSDFLEGNVDIAFTPDGSLLVAVEHEGRLSLPGGFDDVGSSECGIGVVSSTGNIIDFSNSNGVIRWLIPLALDWEENPRISVSPSGDFLVALNGESFDSGTQGVAIQQFASNGDFVGDFFTPHVVDPRPDAYHMFPDIATNGNVAVAVWQDSRQDGNWDISAQFYSSNGPFGENIKVNQGDAVGVLNVRPSVVTNANGTTVVVWIDTRDTDAGEIYGQLYNASGSPVGGNFKISAGQGEIWDRPEVAMRADGSFMVVWTDSLTTISGLDALRARGRQFNSSGNPTSAPFIVPNQDVASGLINIATDGNNYYLSWLDARENDTANVFFKAVGGFFTKVEESVEQVPSEFNLAQNYPNPFNPNSEIQFSVPKLAHVELKVYDLLGREVKTLVNGTKNPGVYRVEFAGDGLPSGLYVYRLKTNGFVQTRKMMLLK